MLLFARAPRVEAGLKGLGRADRLFTATIRRLEQAAQAVGAELVVVGSAPGGARRLAQRGDTFGQRLRHAFDDVWALGYRQVAAVGLDAPSLSQRELGLAFAALERDPVTLGPTPDGGAYLIGLVPEARSVLTGVRWQTRRALADLLAGAGPLPLLPVLWDLDSAADLAQARAVAEPALAALLSECLGASRRVLASGLEPGWDPFVRSLPIRGPPAP